MSFFTLQFKIFSFRRGKPAPVAPGHEGAQAACSCSPLALSGRAGEAPEVEEVEEVEEEESSPHRHNNPHHPTPGDMHSSPTEAAA